MYWLKYFASTKTGDIQLPEKVKESMQMQVEAERRKRATVLESEGFQTLNFRV